MHTHAQSNNSHYRAPYSIVIDSLESLVINQDQDRTNTQGLKINYICKWLYVHVFSDKDY